MRIERIIKTTGCVYIDTTKRVQNDVLREKKNSKNKRPPPPPLSGHIIIRAAAARSEK